MVTPYIVVAILYGKWPRVWRTYRVGGHRLGTEAGKSLVPERLQ